MLSAIDIFDEELMMDHDLNHMPFFLDKSSPHILAFQRSQPHTMIWLLLLQQLCATINTNDFTQQGHGPQSVFMKGHVHHYMKTASTTSQNCILSFFIFDDIAALAGSAERQNVDLIILSEICQGLKNVNSYCSNLCFLGVEARQCAEGNLVITRMVEQIHYLMCALL